MAALMSLLIVPSVDSARCLGCGACAELCPFGAIGFREGVAVIGPSCQKCAACFEVCPVEAISLAAGEAVKKSACQG